MGKRRKIDWVEERIDEYGVKHIYGYNDATGLKYFLNLHDVIRRYEELGIDRYKRSI